MKAEDLKAETKGRWASIYSALGIDVVENKHKPCPSCGGTDRFRFHDQDEQGGYYCNGCGSGDGLSMVMKVFGCNFQEAMKKVADVVGHCEKDFKPNPKTDPRKRLNETWKQSEPLTGKDPVSIYLRNRGLMFRPDCLRYHPALWEPDTKKKYPAMLAQVKRQDGKPITIHRTYLTPDGKKAPIEKPKKTMTPTECMTGGAIRLFPATDAVGLSEGIETSISVYQLFTIPTWTTLSTSVMEGFKPPDGIRKITIFGDNDANFSGQKAAYTLAKRLNLEGYIAEVVLPDITGDFNDVLLAERSAAV